MDLVCEDTPAKEVSIEFIWERNAILNGSDIDAFMAQVTASSVGAPGYVSNLGSSYSGCTDLCLERRSVSVFKNAVFAGGYFANWATPALEPTWKEMIYYNRIVSWNILAPEEDIEGLENLFESMQASTWDRWSKEIGIVEIQRFYRQYTNTGWQTRCV